MSLNFSDSIAIVNAVTATGTTTTAGYDVSKRQLRSIQLLATAITSGQGLFRIDVSNDNVNWTVYNRLTDNLTNANNLNDTRVGSVTISANAYKMYFFPVGDYFRYIRARVGVTTDGTYSVILQAAG